MIEKRGGPNFLAELEPKFGFGEAFRIYGIERIYGITDLLVSPAAGPAEAGPRKAVLRGVGSLGSGSILSPRKSVLFSWELWSLAVCDSDC